MPTLLCIPSDLICDTKSQKTSRISLIKPEQQRLRSYYCDQIKEFIPGVPASFRQEFSKKSQNITKISFQFDELFKIKFRLTDSRFLLKTFQTKLAGTFPVFFYHGLLIFPALICFKASLLLNGFNWCVATKSSTHLELILAYSRNAQPIAFCTKNSLEFE